MSLGARVLQDNLWRDRRKCADRRFELERNMIYALLTAIDQGLVAAATTYPMAAWLHCSGDATDQPARYGPS